MRTIKSLSILSLTVLMLAACGSAGMGDILGGGSSSQGTYEIRGTVDSVDPSSRSIYLTNVSGYSNMLSGNNSSVRVYYDENTRVAYEGKTYSPGSLERGDQISVRVDENGNSLVAESMTVLYDTSGNGTSSPVYGSNTRGTIRYVDTSRRTIEIDTGNGAVATFFYDSSTPVYFGTSKYSVANLERGDEIDVRLRSVSGGYSAETITVVRDASGTTGNNSSYQSTLRGTVVSVDTYNRTITLDSVSYRSGFAGGSSTSNRVVVQYGTNAGVSVQGTLHPVTNLERGDVIDVQVNTTDSTYFANSIVLVSDVSSR